MQRGSSTVPPELPAPAPVYPGLEVLTQLAFDLRSSWHHGTDRLWEAIDPDLWRETGNAWLVLQTASPQRLGELWQTPSFRQQAERLTRERQDGSAPPWFERTHGASKLGAVAFFSMEFALSEALPLYSGGLGNVAGDYLKAALDLGVPMVGVGLLYQQGYFRQTIDPSGAQHEFYPYNSPAQLPVAPVRDAAGAWVRVRLPKPGPPVWLRAWAARVGNIPLYLLDSNDPANTPADRGITAQLYGGGADMRLLQELALGVGGWRVLRAAGWRPDVCHLNEGHAALAALERARDFMVESGRSFEVALAATRAGNVFTTHTPVESGFDRFAPDLAAARLGAYAGELGLSVDALLALGRSRPEDPREPLSMAWLAARCCGGINAVSRRHGQVSRKVFQGLFPRWPEAEVPVDHVTNGVHVPSWDSVEADDLWTKTCGPGRWRGTMDEVGRRIAECSDEEVWSLRSAARAKLVAYARERLRSQRVASGLTGELVEAAGDVLGSDTLTLGLARRFTSYKRPALLLHDAARFARMLVDARRPVQIVVAGKAHPQDEDGKALVREWVRFARRADLRGHVVFLADYDLRLAEQLVQGVDVWINTPRPPWEACGTSGMKVLVNGGLNLSVLDGWWEEAYRPEVGWAPASGASDDDADAAHIYELLERDVIPTFYDRDPSGLPRRWLAKVRASLATLTPRYSANRAVREYTERYYLPAAEAFARRSGDAGAAADRLVTWARRLRTHWDRLRFGEIHVTTEGGRHHFAVPLYLEEIDPDAVTVELYAEGLAGGPPARITMNRDIALVGARGHVYAADVADDRPASHFAPRVVPGRDLVNIPLELPLITWAK
jgi:starch phosphorylase